MLYEGLNGNTGNFTLLKNVDEFSHFKIFGVDGQGSNYITETYTKNGICVLCGVAHESPNTIYIFERKLFIPSTGNQALLYDGHSYVSVSNSVVIDNTYRINKIIGYK